MGEGEGGGKSLEHLGTYMLVDLLSESLHHKKKNRGK